MHRVCSIWVTQVERAYLNITKPLCSWCGRKEDLDWFSTQMHKSGGNRKVALMNRRPTSGMLTCPATMNKVVVFFIFLVIVMT